MLFSSKDKLVVKDRILVCGEVVHTHTHALKILMFN